MSAKGSGRGLPDESVFRVDSPFGFQTDKYRLGYINGFYKDYFALRGESIENFLEIGVCGGGSAKLWAQYFPDSVSIYIADVIPGFLEGNRIKQADALRTEPLFKILGDAYSPEVYSSFSDNFFDVIVDDGPHTLDSHKKLLKAYYSKLKLGGDLIIEDILDPNKIPPLEVLAMELGYSFKAINVKDFVIIDPELWQDLSHAHTHRDRGLWLLHLTK